MNTPEYELAIIEHNEAIKEFNICRDQYRAGKLSDAAFLAAQNIFREASALFDDAFASEQERNYHE